jgi:AcrR family transcriptional regulator
VTKGDETRAAILDRAAELTSQVGILGLTIGSLAEATGLSKSGLFAHFRSKEALQVQVLEHVAARFVERVIKPALRVARGEPRLRALFEQMLTWPARNDLPGGCPIIGAASELDDLEGAARDVLVQQQKDWSDTLATVVKSAVAEGHFRKDVDADQLAFEIIGIDLVFHHHHRLLGDRRSAERARAAFEALVERARK